MIQKKDFIIDGIHDRPILIDVTYPDNKINAPIIIFCHGYKGFKDWGAWHLMANTFANTGYIFIKFNFSHNGGTVEQPIDFPDLDAFGNNNYSKELDDLQTVINWTTSNEAIHKIGNARNITLIGHSRGGGIVSIMAEEDKRVKNVISLAGVCDFGKRTVTIGAIESWRRDGVKYVLNGRTKQRMPHYFQFYTDFIKNEDRLTIKRAVSNLKIPHLILHGNNDTSINIDEAKLLHQWHPDSELVIIDGADHVFGAKHPWLNNHLPKHLESAIKKIMDFLDQHVY